MQTITGTWVLDLDSGLQMNLYPTQIELVIAIDLGVHTHVLNPIKRLRIVQSMKYDHLFSVCNTYNC